MAEKSPVIHLCDVEGHQNNIAEAFCQYHKKLLCISCVVEKTKSHTPECSVMLIRDALKEEDVATLNCLYIRQIARKKQKLILDHGEKVDKIKSDLEQKVNETHANISAHFDALRDKCLNLINTQVTNITDAEKSRLKRLQEIETNLSEYIDTLSTKTDGVDEIQSKMNDIKEEVLERIPDKITVPEGGFKPNASISSLLMQSGASIGHVYVMDRDHYEDIDNKNDHEQVYASSDEVVCQLHVDKCIQVSLPLDTRRHEEEKYKGTQSSQYGTERKQYGFFQRWFSLRRERGGERTGQLGSKNNGKVRNKSSSGEKSDSSPIDPVTMHEEEIYADSTFIPPIYKPPKYLINKTVNIKMKQEFSSACKFSKLVGLGKSYVGLLSDVHKSLVFVGTEGQFLGRKQFQSSNVAVTTIGSSDVAVITEPNCQGRKFRVSEKGFETIGSFTVHNISNITGFNYDLSLSMYAVSSCDKIIILDKSGKQMKCVQYSETDAQGANNLVTAYDFKNECLYILKKNEKTLKSYSLKKSTVVWKRKIDSDSVVLRSICLHKEKLYVACSDAVAIFSSDTGEPIVKHEVKDLIDDCLGICVIDDVLALSSNSDDFVKSTSLAYISI